MRADKLIMIGVGAMGLYAVYRMLKTDGKSAPTDSAPGSLPVAATSLDPRQVLSNSTSLLLKAQTQYRMRLELEGGLPPFSESSSDAEIATALSQLGFRGFDLTDVCLHVLFPFKIFPDRCDRLAFHLPSNCR